MNFSISQKGLELIASFEGCRLTAYKLSGEQYFTIGYGHYGPDVYEGMNISQDEALNMFKTDIKKFEAYVVAYCRWDDMWQEAYDMLVSFAYNRGPGSLSRVAANYHSAYDMINDFPLNWGTAATYKNGLIKRREKEKAYAMATYTGIRADCPYYKADGETLIAALKSIGVDSSYSNREKLYYSQVYEGTPEQNIYLLEALRAGRLKKP